jgi:hypothetical protein
MPELSNEMVVREGWLQKQGTGLRKAWEKRFCVLSQARTQGGGFVRFFEDDGKKRLKGLIDIRELLTTLRDEKPASTGVSFTVLAGLWW